MYESFYGLKEKPFSMLPDPGFMYLSKKHQKALTLFEYGLMSNAGFCVISGEIGSGKTTLLRKLLDNMSRKITVGMITNTHKQFGELLDWVLSAFDIHERGLNEVEKHQRFIDFLLEQYAAKKTTLLIVDEAQNMTPDKLEELRMLSNINTGKDQVLQVILSGQPELQDTLRLPEMKQFIQRIAVDYHLVSLNEEETLGYIEHRLSVAGADKPIFTKEAGEMLHKYSGGTPRLLNLLCDTAMVYGFADQKEIIDDDIVAEMILERMQDSLVPLVCTESPQKKGKGSVSKASPAEEPVVEGTADNDPGGKILQASETEKNTLIDSDDNAQDTAQAEVVDAVEQNEKVGNENDVPSVQEENELADTDESESDVESSADEASSVTVSPETLPATPYFFKPLVVALAVLVLILLVYALNLDTDDSIAPAVPDNQTTPEEINSEEAQSLPAEIESAVPDAMKQQLEDARKTQEEMERRQQEDSARLKALEEQAVLLQKERDQAVKKAKVEEEKRLAEEETARIATEKEALAKQAAEKAIEEAEISAREAAVRAEQRIKDELAKEAALKAEQEALEKQQEQEAAAQAKAAEKKALEEANCDGPAARFLSTCR